MKTIKHIYSILTLVVFALLFWASATQYKSVGFTGGFSEIQLDSNKFTISFRGNGYTSTERATDMCLLRCAELCKQNGYDYFIIADSKTEIRKSYYSDDTKSQSDFSVDNYGNSTHIHGNTRTTGGDITEIHKPGIRNTIICYKGQPKSDDIICYKPTFLINSIKTKYQIVDTK